MLHCSLLENLESFLCKGFSNSLSPNIPPEGRRRNIYSALLILLSTDVVISLDSPLLFPLPSDYGSTGSRFVAPAPPPPGTQRRKLGEERSGEECVWLVVTFTQCSSRSGRER